MTPELVARIVDQRESPAFVALLGEADVHLRDPAFEASLVDALRAQPRLIELWNLWSGDQRWTPSAAVDGNETAWVTSGGGSEHVTVHPDGAAAVADFIHRMAACLARREVIATDE